MLNIDDASTYIELNLKECGREICIPEKAIVFSKKKYHLFHYVVSGKGYFELGKKRYVIRKGMVFYIPPDSDAKYAPDKENPWTYVWIGFSGANVNSFLLRAGISNINPIYKDDEKKNLRRFFDGIYNEYEQSGYLNVSCLGLAYELFGAFLKFSKEESKAYSQSDSYVMSTKTFIENNYQFDVKMYDVANSVGVSPNYLTNLFHKKMGVSPKRYLTQVRMQKAEVYLLTNQYKIKEVAKLTGYKNQLHFSNEFKKYYHISPQAYVKKFRKD